MAVASLTEFARLVGSNTLLGIAQKLGVSPPPPPISVRSLIRLFGLPSAPVNLKLSWDLDEGGRLRLRAPDFQAVPSDKTIGFYWNDPSNLAVSKATSYQLQLKIAATGRDFDLSPFSVRASGQLGVAGFKPSTSYWWGIVPFNAFGQGPASDVFTFRTAPVSTPAPPPARPGASAPTITVVYSPPAAAAKFHVTGSGFVANHIVHIRGVNNVDLQHPAYGNTTADASGAIDIQLNIPCLPGTRLSFSANDERPDSNMTGTLWSNTVTVTAS
jgi:hypothetical protein